MGLGNENIALINRLGGITGECISTNEAILCAEIEANYNQITALDNDVKIARAKITSLTDTLEAVTAVCNGSSAMEHLDQFRAADTMLQESNNERFRTAIEKAVERLEEIDVRDGGVAWHKSKEMLGADLFLVLHGLRGALVQSV